MSGYACRGCGASLQSRRARCRACGWALDYNPAIAQHEPRPAIVGFAIVVAAIFMALLVGICIYMDQLSRRKSVRRCSPIADEIPLDRTHHPTHLPAVSRMPQSL